MTTDAFFYKKESDVTIYNNCIQKWAWLSQIWIGVCILFLRELLKRVLCRRLEECSSNTSKINFINCHYVNKNDIFFISTTTTNTTITATNTTLI